MALHNGGVAEMQGLYGPFTITERVLQKVWLRGDFDRTHAVLTDGRPLEIRAGGTWNLLGGPDFHDARLLIGGREVSGDVEVHFHAADWIAHQHARNPAFDRVVLHVVLFAPDASSAPVCRADGAALPTLVLLPLLCRDLEEYASDDALETITDRNDWSHLAELAALPVVERRSVLHAAARQRWEQKVRFARLRIDRLGWREAAHHTALEILGYRSNRAAMLGAAARFPLETWTAATPLQLFAGSLPWNLHGVRPANHPRVRLQQYAAWVAARPDWTALVPEFFAAVAPGVETGENTPRFRQACRLRAVRERFAREVVAGAVGGVRLDNLVCDGLLPLLAAQSGKDPFAWWFHWFLGDVPANVRAALVRLGVVDGRLHPFCHGFAQGLMGWLLSRSAAQVTGPAKTCRGLTSVRAI